MGHDLLFGLVGGLVVLAVAVWAAWRWKVPPQALEARVLETGDDAEPEPEEWPLSRRVFWITEAEMDRRGIPWEQRVADPKDKAVWACRHLADEIAGTAPYLPALGSFLASVRTWEDAAGQSAGLGWAVYRDLGKLEKAVGFPLPSHIAQAVLKAVSATPPQPKQSKEV